MRHLTALWTAAVLVVLVLMACGGSGGGSITGPSAGPARDPNNNWNVQGDPTHSFTIECDTCPASAADLTGDEGLGGVVSPLTGSFSGDSIEFTVSRASGDVLFEGRFLDDDTIEVSSSTETLTLIRDLG